MVQYLEKALEFCMIKILLKNLKQLYNVTFKRIASRDGYF
jgi:hypothetical protein